MAAPELYFGRPDAVGKEDLGLLAQLPGTWVGHGFNLIARPDKQNNQPFFLELNATSETINFVTIGGDIPNRGSLQGDIEIHGIHYLQQVTDRKDNSGIHIEPGLWLHVPPTTDPAVATETYVRQATIPHGDSLVAQSTLAITVNGGPLINPVDSTPFTDAAIPALNSSPTTPVPNPAYMKPFTTDALPQFLPAGLNAADTIKNPALVLLADIKGQTITNTVVIQISTKPTPPLPGLGIVNTAFVDDNANAIQMDAIFWIETVKDPEHGEYLQLQYVQRVILDFIGIHWPHISVATLRKQQGPRRD
ncbi:heme-binding protein [Rhodopila sp.]|uniref:heme-binding protein n=1 Tax=Rhodopila sp. TaxID=2480087 RepID=UPI003D0B8261